MEARRKRVDRARTVILESCDGDQFTTTYDAARMSLAVREEVNMDPESTEPIVLPLVSTKHLAKIVEYLELRLANQLTNPIVKFNRPLKGNELHESNFPEWTITFANSVSPHDILSLAEAAEAMRIKMLESLLCARIAVEIRRAGNAKLATYGREGREWTQEDSRKLKRENPWAWQHQDEDPVENTLLSDGEEAPPAAAE